MSEVQEYGKSKLPCGDLSGKEVIVVEGRADVLNLLKNNVKNVIAMNGTKLPDEIKELSQDKDILLYVDGDRGGKLIAQNVVDNAKVKFIAVAPEGKEVEELTGKEILMNLRKKVSPGEFLSFSYRPSTRRSSAPKERKQEATPFTLKEKDKETLKTIAKKNEGSKRAIALDSNLSEIKTISVRALSGFLKRERQGVAALVVDGSITPPILYASEDAGVSVIVANNFSATSDNIQFLSY